MLNINTLNRLDLGVQGENKAKTICIDISPWLHQFPYCEVYLWHMRNGETLEYAPEYVEVDYRRKILKWTPSSRDTFYAGCGKCGIGLTEGDVIKKHRDIDTYVFMTNSVSPGAPTELWDYDELRNRPKINSVTLTGNKSFAQLGLFDDTLTQDNKAISAKKAAQTFVPWNATWGDLEDAEEEET